MSNIGHNHGFDETRKEQLRNLATAIEQIEAQIEDLKEEKKAVFDLAKDGGFHVPTMKACIKLRKKDPQEAKEKQALQELYGSVLVPSIFD